MHCTTSSGAGTESREALEVSAELACAVGVNEHVIWCVANGHTGMPPRDRDDLTALGVDAADLVRRQEQWRQERPAAFREQLRARGMADD